MKPRSRKGGTTIFLCLTLSSVIMLFGILWQAARFRAAENDINRALSAQARTTLARYDQTGRQFGLFAFSAEAADSDVFRSTLPDAMRACSVDVVPGKPLTEPEVLKKQVIRYMKARLPAVYLEKLVSRLSGVEKALALPAAGASAGSSSGNVSDSGAGMAGMISGLTGSISSDLIADTVGSLAGDTLSKFRELLLEEIESFYHQLTPDLAGASSDQPLDRLADSVPDFLDPESMTDVAGIFDQIMDFETVPLYDHVCLVEYILGHFRQAVETVSGSTGNTPLLTIDGRCLSDLPESRRCEAEMILTGQNTPDAAAQEVQAILTVLRSVIWLIWTLTDQQQMSELRTTATTLAVAIAIASGATVDPEIITYLLAVGRAIAGALGDCRNLLSGKLVNVWPGRSAYNLALGYQDYMRIFLLVMPDDQLLARTGQRLAKALPSTMFTEITLTAHWGSRAYSTSGEYD